MAVNVLKIFGFRYFPLCLLAATFGLKINKFQ